MMEKVKFAQLDYDQLKELTELEEKLGVTLIAYDPKLKNENTEQIHMEISDDFTIL
ncbi:hypothetical protein [Lysinibacillus sp. BW-2-10]|uniref:hypothetical protein n=1 Tax=Lysinibacillus sp. BW-2-10 TaxID=2590030 RepID=UPI001642F977|nr:hypothetical protein [Lysinibacillus sp. BW-2-10]